jgi:outer membrane immunogenic protein
MRKLLIGGAMSLIATSGTLAADLQARAPVVVAPVWSWTGFYIGGSLGSGWLKETDSATALIAGVGIASASATTDSTGLVGGGHVGFNWQAGYFVFGAEADINGSEQRSSTTASCAAAACAGIISSVTTAHQIESFETVRGRVGLAFERWLVYVTGGFALQTVNNNISVNAGGVATPLSGSSATQSGYVVGAGVETALWGTNWIGGVEYLYLDSGTFATAAASLGPVPAAPAASSVTATERLQNSILRARVSYKF